MSDIGMAEETVAKYRQDLSADILVIQLFITKLLYRYYQCECYLH